MSGGEVIRKLNQAGLSARLIAGRVYISPAYRITREVRALVQENREALMESLAGFGRLNVIEPEASGMPYEAWLRALPASAFREDNR